MKLNILFEKNICNIKLILSPVEYHAISLRGDESLARTIKKCKENKNSLLRRILQEVPSSRLESKKPPCVTAECLLSSNLCGFETWKKKWAESEVMNQEPVADPCKTLKIMYLPIRTWLTVNRIRTGQGRCEHLLHKRKCRDDLWRDCGWTKQTMDHILTECPKRRFSQGLTSIHNFTPESIEWINLQDIDLRSISYNV